MKKYALFLTLLSVVAFFYGCQKEVNFDDSVPSIGMLQSDLTGDCLPKTVSGTYEVGTALTAGTNYIEVQVEVLQPGSYTIYTDTVSGIHFRATGIFSATGLQTVKLTGKGTPVTAGTSNFLVMYNLTLCEVAVSIVPDGTATQAVFSLSREAGGECTGAVVSGNYAAGIALTSANQAVIGVNVTTAGTYDLQTTATNGITFAGTGSLATGPQTITLTATGTPGTAGITNIPVTAGSTSCSFPVTVTGPATFTVDCGTAAVQGTYTQGVALDATNKVNLNVTVVAAGGYMITGTVNGMTFAHTGNFPAPGPQTITLAATGTPAAAGTFNVPLTAGTAPCNFSVTVAPAAPVASDYFPRSVNSNWSYEADDDPDDSILVKVIPQTKVVSGNTFNIFMGTNDATAGFDTSGYYRKAGGSYNRFVNLANYFGLDNNQWVEFTFIKDDQAAGHTWTTATYTNTTQGFPVQIRIKFTILQKDVTVSVDGTPYANTIVVEERYELNLGAGWEDGTPYLGYYKDYYSRNVGWILDELYDEMNNLEGKIEMRRYQVF